MDVTRLLTVTGRWLRRRARPALPVLLDVSAFIAAVIGAARLWGDVAWLVAAGLLVLAGLRAQE